MKLLLKLCQTQNQASIKNLFKKRRNSIHLNVVVVLHTLINTTTKVKPHYNIKHVQKALDCNSPNQGLPLMNDSLKSISRRYGNETFVSFYLQH